MENTKINAASMVGQRLHAKRTEKGLTRDQLAEATGVKVGSIETTETGRRLPNGEHIFRVCRFFEVSPNWVLTGSDEYQAEEGCGNAALVTEAPQLVTAMDEGFPGSLGRCYGQCIIVRLPGKAG